MFGQIKRFIMGTAAAVWGRLGGNAQNRDDRESDERGPVSSEPLYRWPGAG